jgi:hypothetical protein
MTSSRQPGVAFWATVVVVMVLSGMALYVITAPLISLWVCEGIMHGALPQWMADSDFVVCWPLRLIIKNCPVPIPDQTLHYYSGLFWH